MHFIIQQYKKKTFIYPGQVSFINEQTEEAGKNHLK